MKKTTLADIAKAVNVSKTTVSMVINNKDINTSKETREKILKTAKELNYVPNFLAKSLSSKKTFTIGVIVPDIQNPFFSKMAKGIEKVAEENGYSIILCNTLNNKKRELNHIRLLMSKSVDGVIIIPIGNECEGLNLLETQGIPFVIVDRIIDDFENLNCVFCDSEKGIEEGIDYLYSKGKRNIAFVSGKLLDKVSILRHKAYINKAKELGIYNENLSVQEEITLEGGFIATKKLIEKEEKIDSIFYSSDVLAIGGMKYLIRKGFKIPEDISILGFDNIDICEFIEPELSTVAQPIYHIGKEAIRLLLKLINKETVLENIVKLEPYLIERWTVK